MVAPKEGWHKFKDEAEKLDYMKGIKLIPKTKGLRPIYYTGIYVDLIAECDVVGYVDNYTTVISVGGELHCIHPDFLLEMQSSPTAKKYRDTHSADLIFNELI